MASPASSSVSLPSLRVPVEVLERILEFACSRRSSTPLDPAPPPLSSALLLVSRGLTSLVLPFYYRAVTIYNPSDWSAFFGPQRGIFVAGELAERRRNALVELTLRHECPPIDTPRIDALLSDPDFDPRSITDFLVPIANDISFPSLTRVCLLAGPDRLSSVWQPSLSAETSLVRRLRPLTSLQDAPTEEVFDWIRSTSDRISGPCFQPLSSRRAESYLSLFSASPIKEVHLSFAHNLYDLKTIYQAPCPTAKVYLHAGPEDFQVREGEEPRGGEAFVRPPDFDWLCDLAEDGQDLVVVGMPEGQRRNLGEVAKKHGIGCFFTAERGGDGVVGAPRPVVG